MELSTILCGDLFVLATLVEVFICAKTLTAVVIRDLRGKKREKKLRIAAAEGKVLASPAPEKPFIKEAFLGAGDSVSSLGTEFSNSSCENISSPGFVVGGSPSLNVIE